MKYSNIVVTKRYMLKNHYDTHQRLMHFEDINPKYGQIKSIVTVPHDIYVDKKGTPISVQMQVTQEAINKFTYDNNVIVAL